MINLQKVKRYCTEHYTEIENYELAVADKENTWVCHHRFGENNSFYGKKHSDTTKDKIRQKLLGSKNTKLAERNKRIALAWHDYKASGNCVMSYRQFLRTYKEEICLSK